MVKKFRREFQKNTDSFLEEFRDKWPRGKLSLLSCHIFHALDETRDWDGWLETENMDEAEMMFTQLILDLKRLIPEKKQKINLKDLEKDFNSEKETDHEDV